MAGTHAHTRAPARVCRAKPRGNFYFLTYSIPKHTMARRILIKPKKTRKMVKRKRRSFPFTTLAPDTMRVKLRYSETISFPQANNSYDTIMRGNCHHDCNVTATGPGVSAYGALTWSNIYKRAYVEKSNITVRVLNEGTNTIVTTVFPSNSADPSGTAGYRARRKAVVSNIYTDTKRISTTAHTAAILGQARTAIWNYQTNPIEANYPVGDWFWHIVTERPFGTGGQVILLLEIDYWVTFSDRRQEVLYLQPPDPPV